MRKYELTPEIKVVDIALIYFGNITIGDCGRYAESEDK